MQCVTLYQLECVYFRSKWYKRVRARLRVHNNDDRFRCKQQFGIVRKVGL